MQANRPVDRVQAYDGRSPSVDHAHIGSSFIPTFSFAFTVFASFCRWLDANAFTKFVFWPKLLRFFCSLFAQHLRVSLCSYSDGFCLSDSFLLFQRTNTLISFQVWLQFDYIWLVTISVVLRPDRCSPLLPSFVTAVHTFGWLGRLWIHKMHDFFFILFWKRPVISKSHFFCFFFFIFFSLFFFQPLISLFSVFFLPFPFLGTHSIWFLINKSQFAPKPKYEGKQKDEHRSLLSFRLEASFDEST